MAIRKTPKSTGSRSKGSYSNEKRPAGKSFTKKDDKKGSVRKSFGKTAENKSDYKKKNTRFSEDSKPARKYSSTSREAKSPRSYSAPKRDDQGSRPLRDGAKSRTYSPAKGNNRSAKPTRPGSYSLPKGEDRETRPTRGSAKPRTYSSTNRDDRKAKPTRPGSYSSSRGEDQESRPTRGSAKPRTYSSSGKDDKRSSGRGGSKPRTYSSGHSRNNDKRVGFKKQEDETTEIRPANRFSRTSESRIFKGKEESRDEKTTTRSFKKPGFDKAGTGFKKTERGAYAPKTGEKRDYKTERRTGEKSFDKIRKPRSQDEDYVEEKLSENIRLNRYISNAGICSRREADKLISTGLVSVNGAIITEMGYQVQPGDDVRFNGERLSREKKVYIIMNKPKDAITTLDDPDGRNTVMDVLGSELRERVFPIGRLDRNTTGVLLLTNDGELAQRLMHPKYEVEKVYKATLNKVLKGEDLWQLSNGVELEDGFIKPDEVAYPDPKVKSEVGVQIHSGRNRIIHRMFEHLGYVVDRLDRVSYGGFMKTGLKRGEWRHLNDKELKKLKRIVKLG